MTNCYLKESLKGYGPQRWWFWWRLWKVSDWKWLHCLPLLDSLSCLCICLSAVIYILPLSYVVPNVDREIFTLKIIRVKNFHVVKFSRFCSIREIFLTVDYCNMDERLESSWGLVYYQVSGEPGITGCSCRSDIYLVECGLARKLIHWSSPCNFIICAFNFHDRPQPF